MLLIYKMLQATQWSIVACIGGALINFFLSFINFYSDMVIKKTMNEL